jgi:septal ring factor EnvC (AmiA/AmiB activator)
MRTPRVRLAASSLAVVVAIALIAIRLGAQSSPAGDDAGSIGDRIKGLQKESSRLAAESKTLLGQLQTLEVDRQLRVAEAQRADQNLAAAQKAVDAANGRLEALDRERQAQLPSIEAQLVNMYKHGPTGYVQMLLASKSFRDFARVTRAVTTLAAANAQRVVEHRQTLEKLRREKTDLEQQMQSLQARRDEAQRAQQAAERAVSTQRELATRIDKRRDLNAQYVGELQVAYDKLQQQLPGSKAPAGAANPAATASSNTVPLAASSDPDAATGTLTFFRGGLDWPVPGELTARFGQTANRVGGTAVKNGIEISAPEGTPVKAVHEGMVRFADVFTGFGQLVIVDHGGSALSLYGYLSSTSVARGDMVASGAEVGRVGTPPGGMPALYFEVRIDGRSVDPLQWLKTR